MVPSALRKPGRCPKTDEEEEEEEEEGREGEGDAEGPPGVRGRVAAAEAEEEEEEEEGLPSEAVRCWYVTSVPRMTVKRAARALRTSRNMRLMEGSIVVSTKLVARCDAWLMPPPGLPRGDGDTEAEEAARRPPGAAEPARGEARAPTPRLPAPRGVVVAAEDDDNKASPSPAPPPPPPPPAAVAAAASSRNVTSGRRWPSRRLPIVLARTRGEEPGRLFSKRVERGKKGLKVEAEEEEAEEAEKAEEEEAEEAEKAEEAAGAEAAGSAAETAKPPGLRGICGEE